MSVNKAMLLGRLGKDPELKTTNNGTAVCNFTIATSEKYKDQETTTWHNIVAWSKQAELIADRFSKGSEIFVEGRIVNRSYEDKDGNKKYVSEIVLSQFSFVGKREQREEDAPDLPTPAEEEESNGSDDDDDNLPF